MKNQTGHIHDLFHRSLTTYFLGVRIGTIIIGTIFFFTQDEKPIIGRLPNINEAMSKRKCEVSPSPGRKKASTTLAAPEAADSNICPVCFDGCSSEVVLSSCIHSSCKMCLARWIEREEETGRPSGPTCPFCRMVIAEKDVAKIMDRPHPSFRKKWQRLLLLHHAAKCTHQDNQCLVTPHCAGMKRLWKHIAECKDQKCLEPHCVSSRYVMSHYHRCKDVRCQVCEPVRKAIQWSHQNRRRMQA